MPQPSIGGAASMPGLLQLPLEVLRTVWQQLETVADRHALRSTCTAMRAASTPWITSLSIGFLGCHWCDSQQAGLQLSMFPRDAMLQSLHIESKRQANRPQYCRHRYKAGINRDLLTHLILDYTTRLAGLQRLHINHLDLSNGDVLNLAGVCHGLRHLALTHCRLSSITFAPLSRLTSLDSLSLLDVVAPERHQRILKDIPTTLTALTIRHLESQTAPDDYETEPAKFMPFLAHLHGLRSLSVLAKDVDEWDIDFDSVALTHISHLRHLTHLTVSACDLPELPLAHALACASCLVELHLPEAIPNTAAIRAVAALPCLQSLSVHELRPAHDLSDLVWGKAKVTVQTCSGKYVLRLPRQVLQALAVNSHYCNTIEWTLDSADSLQSVCEQVHAAAAVLAHTVQGSTPTDSVRLCRYSAPCLSLAWDAAPPYNTSSVLAALAPLHLQGLRITLGTNWALCESHVQQLLRALPSLRELHLEAQVGQDINGFMDFLEALQTSPCPSVLSLYAGLPTEVFRSEFYSIGLTLLALARARADNKHRITIAHGGLLTDARIQRHMGRMTPNDRQLVVFRHY